MKITSVNIIPHQLKFKFEAGTSRGALKEKKIWYILLYQDGRLIGTGEVSPLKNLSIDPIEEIEDFLSELSQKLEGVQIPASMEVVLSLVSQLCSDKFPSVRFAIETALLEALYGSNKTILPTDFTQNEKRIPINGLIWMGNEEFMRSQIKDKIQSGFNCIKMKIGAIDFQKELELLSFTRDQFEENELILRVDANGAFTEKDALEKLDKLFALGIHSIEQPIKAGQRELMQQLCEESPLPIALDEELIGIHTLEEKQQLLEEIKPQYIILKPSLIGGIQSTLEWVKVAEGLNIGWWMTSMLESNVGLNAICQLADYLEVEIHQGLGTGQLYHNNIDSPLTIEKGHIYYNKAVKWGEVEAL